MTTPFLRLPFTFDREALAADLARCLESDWPAHFNTRDYRGEWTSLALRSVSGHARDIASVPGAAGYRNTPLVDLCPTFRSVLETFECALESARLLRLAAGSVIHEHRDPGASYSDGFFRLHIPITSNDRTRFLIDSQPLTMQPGECWYADFGLPHSVTNAGATDRVHLVVDGLRNAWSDDVFARAGYDFAAERRRGQMDPETARHVIAELRARGTEIDLRLADDLERRGSSS